MQIRLSHFASVRLTKQGKKTNAAVIEEYTGVKNYAAHEAQIRTLCSLIFRRSYPEMRKRVSTINRPDTEPASTNFIHFLEKFESSDARWIRDMNRFLPAESGMREELRYMGTVKFDTDESLKNRAETVFVPYGLTLEEAVSLFLRSVAEEGCLPGSVLDELIRERVEESEDENNLSPVFSSMEEASSWLPD